MSIVSGGRAEVEDQHHVSSNPMQTELGSSCVMGHNRNLQRRTGLSTDMGESHRALPRRSGE